MLGQFSKGNSQNNKLILVYLLSQVMWRRGKYSTSILIYLSGKYEETRKSCLLSVENGMGVAT